MHTRHYCWLLDTNRNLLTKTITEQSNWWQFTNICHTVTLLFINQHVSVKTSTSHIWTHHHSHLCTVPFSLSIAQDQKYKCTTCQTQQFFARIASLWQLNWSGKHQCHTSDKKKIACNCTLDRNTTRNLAVPNTMRISSANKVCGGTSQLPLA